MMANLFAQAGVAALQLPWLPRVMALASAAGSDSSDGSPLPPTSVQDVCRATGHLTGVARQHQSNQRADKNLHRSHNKSPDGCHDDVLPGGGAGHDSLCTLLSVHPPDPVATPSWPTTSM